MNVRAEMCDSLLDFDIDRVTATMVLRDLVFETTISKVPRDCTLALVRIVRDWTRKTRSMANNSTKDSHTFLC